MKSQQTSIVDYRKFRFSKLKTPEFSHVWWLIYWPIFGVLFYTLERIWIRDYYHPMYCGLDDFIPFMEIFLIPYLFWFVFLIGIHVYTLLFDIAAFRRLMVFVMVSYSITIVVYTLFPNCQELRPVEFERDNFLTRFMAGYYVFDTNTNVLPSLHVIGSVAAVVGAWDSRHFSGTGWRIAFSVTAFFIAISTVFLKQHSILDLFAAIPVCAVSILCVWLYERRRVRLGRMSPWEKPPVK